MLKKKKASNVDNHMHHNARHMQSDAAPKVDLWSRRRRRSMRVCAAGFDECIKPWVVPVQACRANRPPRCNNKLDSCSVCLRWRGGWRELWTSDEGAVEEKAEQLKEKGPRGAAGAATGNGWSSVGGRVTDQRPRNGWWWWWEWGWGWRKKSELLWKLWYLPT